MLIAYCEVQFAVSASRFLPFEYTDAVGLATADRKGNCTVKNPRKNDQSRLNASLVDFETFSLAVV